MPANSGKFWKWRILHFGNVVFSWILQLKYFIPSPPKCRPQGHLESGLGWEDKGEMNLQVHERSQASLRNPVTGWPESKEEKEEVNCLLLCFLWQKQRELEKPSACCSHIGPAEPALGWSSHLQQRDTPRNEPPSCFAEKQVWAWERS